MENFIEFKKKIEEKYNNTIEILNLFESISKTDDSIIFKIYTKNHKSLNAFLNSLYTEFSSNKKLKSIINSISKKEFIDMCKVSLRPSIRKRLFSNKQSFTKEEKAHSVNSFIENLRYFIMSKQLNILINSISRDCGIDSSKFNISFIDLNKSEDGIFFESSDKRSEYLDRVLERNNKNGKININFIFGASKEVSIHSNILINFNGKYYSIDTVPTANYVPNLLKNKLCLQNKLTILQIDGNSCIKKSINLITNLTNIFDIVYPKNDADMIDKFLSYGLTKYKKHLRFSEDLETVDANSQLFFLAPLYAISTSDFLIFKTKSLSYLLRERQYLQILSNSKCLFPKDATIENDEPSNQYTTVEDKRVRTTLDAYYDGKSISNAINITEKLVEINNRLLNSLIYSLRSDFNKTLLQNKLLEITGREEKLKSAEKELKKQNIKLILNTIYKEFSDTANMALYIYKPDAESYLLISSIRNDVKQSFIKILNFINDEFKNELINPAIFGEISKLYCRSVNKFDNFKEGKNPHKFDYIEHMIIKSIGDIGKKLEAKLEHDIQEDELLDIIDDVDKTLNSDKIRRQYSLKNLIKKLHNRALKQTEITDGRHQ